jgi:hypothetical protein
MFISSNEKQSMLLRIDTLESRVETLGRSLNAVMDKLTTKQGEESRKIYEALKEKRRAYARDYYYRMKAKKAAVNSTK